MHGTTSASAHRPKILDLGAAETAKQIAEGEISAVEAVEAHIARIEAVNGALNAVVLKRYDDARGEARAIDRRRRTGEPIGPLAGVPVTVKECLDLAGTPSTFGIPGRAGIIATSDAPAVARLRAAGAIVLGKTNVAQLLMFTETDNPLHGRTNNPWDVERSSGGGSGGEGAIIAAGGSTLGLGTDIGGSVRIPAAFCGIAGFRPTAGRVPDLGRFSLPFGQQAVASQVGPLARDVADLALALSVINGEGADRRPAAPLGDFRAVDTVKLRVAVFDDDGAFRLAPAARRAVAEAAAMLGRAGAHVEEWRPPSIGKAIALFFASLSGDGGAGMKRITRGEPVDKRIASLIRLAGMPHWLNRSLAAGLDLAGQKGLAMGLRAFGHMDADHYWQAVEAIHDYRGEVLAALDRGSFDAILFPAYAVPAVRHGATMNLPLPGAYTLLGNVTGFPAGVVPVTRVRAGEETERLATRDVVLKTAREAELGSAGLPIAVQVMARPWADHVALALMETIEREARKDADYPARPLP